MFVQTFLKRKIGNTLSRLQHYRYVLALLRMRNLWWKKVSKDFCTLILMILNHMASLFISWALYSIFEYGFDFAKRFACAKNSALSLKPRSQAQRFFSNLKKQVYEIFNSLCFLILQYSNSIGPKIHGLKTVLCRGSSFITIFKYKNHTDSAVSMTPRSQTPWC